MESKLRMKASDIRLILGLVILFGGLFALIVYAYYLKSLPHRYSISKEFRTEWSPKGGRAVFFTYDVEGREYESSHSVPKYDLCNDCKYVVKFTVGKESFASLVTDHPIPDSITLVPPPQGWDSIPVEWRGGFVIVKDGFKKYKTN